MAEPPDVVIKKKPLVQTEAKVKEGEAHVRDDFQCWGTPDILRNPNARQMLDEFAASCCPEVQLYIVRKWMEKANRLIFSRANQEWIRSGGLGQVLRDLKRAEKALLTVYGLDDVLE